ncbi:cyclophilin-like fold protein [Desulfotomaculum sp. 1211_IL3151]|uniref:cyclophilin-like fold protein n=1 Tax=Desulfotomaculum sp. 1211_IL3151 TaxID=3084055 RepID=UPI002FD8812D
MRKVILSICVVLLSLCLIACDTNETNESKQIYQHEVEVQKRDSTQQTAATIDLSLRVGNKTFSAKLYDNQTTHALVDNFPITVDMSELNGNEKYYYLSNTLPTASEQPGEIHAGDIMLYGDDCLVVFYETFSSTYKYTRLGYVEDATGFAQAVGDGNITVTFDLVK